MLAAFKKWAVENWSVGWVLGDCLANTATPNDLATLLELAENSAYRRNRQMIVYSLWRYKKDDRTRDALVRLIEDPDVALHAMSALRRPVGNHAAIPILARIRDGDFDLSVKKQAEKAIRAAERAVAKLRGSVPNCR